jgi:hypothetical protein
LIFALVSLIEKEMMILEYCLFCFTGIAENQKSLYQNSVWILKTFLVGFIVNLSEQLAISGVC